MIEYSQLWTGPVRAHRRRGSCSYMSSLVRSRTCTVHSSYMLHAEAIIHSTSPLIAAERLIGGRCPP